MAGLRNDIEQLFTDEPSDAVQAAMSPPAVPVTAAPEGSGGFGAPPSYAEAQSRAGPPPASFGAPSAPAAPAAGPGVTAIGGGGSDNTLDEPVLDTIKRDMFRIAENLKMVVMPFLQSKQPVEEGTALANWDLWGPLIFTLILAITLSSQAQDASKVFSLVFALMAFGAIVLTANVILLGGSLVFFQSLCLLGYCIFPIDVGVILCSIIRIVWLRLVIMLGAIVWSAWASLPFIATSVPQPRRALAIYPVLLLYTCLGWMALVA